MYTSKSIIEDLKDCTHTFEKTLNMVLKRIDDNKLEKKTFDKLPTKIP